MITFKNLGAYGRMGNQMFQYALLYSIAKTREYEFGIPYNLKSNNPYFNMCLSDAFDNLSAKNSDDAHIIYQAQEKVWGYNAGIFGISDNTDILGYFQSEKYFVDYRAQLLKEFEFKQDIKRTAFDIRSITKEPVISVHLRLGDYKNLVGKHPICTLDYYKEALGNLPEDLLIVAFSDEPELAKDLFNSLERKYFITESNNQYVDMCTMSICDYHVIANSSFSWWGAWLGESKKVIAPSQWFGNSPDMPKNWSDIYCKDWMVI